MEVGHCKTSGHPEGSGARAEVSSQGPRMRESPGTPSCSSIFCFFLHSRLSLPPLPRLWLVLLASLQGELVNSSHRNTFVRSFIHSLITHIYSECIKHVVSADCIPGTALGPGASFITVNRADTDLKSQPQQPGFKTVTMGQTSEQMFHRRRSTEDGIGR